MTEADDGATGPDRAQPGYPEWNPARDCGPDESAQEYAEKYRQRLNAWRAKQQRSASWSP
jgi:hypothetical protein